MREEPSFRQAMGAAGRMLSYRPLTQEQLREKLIGKEFDPKIVEIVLQRMTELGYLDDRAFADRAVEVFQRKGYGSLRIRQELRRRGVDRETAEQALSRYHTDEDAIDRQLAKKLKGERDFKACRRAAASLYRKGYTGEEIHRAMERYQTEEKE